MKHVGNGITQVVVDLALEQVATGMQVTVGSAGGDYEDIIKKAGVSPLRVDMRRRSIGRSLRAVVLLRTELRRSQFDVIHCHTIWATVIARFAARASGNRIPVVATVHNEYQRGVWLMYIFANHLVGVSGAVSEAIINWGIPKDRVTTIINGVSGSRRRGTNPPDIELNHPAVVFCGGVSHRKGADRLVEAVLALARWGCDLHVYLIGNIDWRVPVDVARSSEFADRFHFLGFREDPRGHMRAADIFILPSRREPLGLVLLEAMAEGTLAIGTNVDGIPEALDYGRAGVVLRSGDSEEIATQIGFWLNHRDEMHQLAAAGQRYALSLSARNMSNAYLQVYEKLNSKN